jgi:DNA-binding XRE family transcriptional regulator
MTRLARPKTSTHLAMPHLLGVGRWCVPHGCTQKVASTPLFGFSSVRYTAPMPVQFTPRRSHHAPRFPNAIRQYRVKAGLSQRQLAAAFGRCRSAVSLWERGLRMPRASRLFDLATQLGTVPQALYFDLIARKAEKSETAKPVSFPVK